MRLRIKTGSEGGHLTNSANNILWGNSSAIVMLDDSMAVVSYSDVQGTNWPGTGNLNSDPLFTNPALGDYRLSTNSPLLAAGLSGADMGAAFPVGAPMALSHLRIESAGVTNGSLLLNFQVDPERIYTVEESERLNGALWSRLANIGSDPYPRKAEVILGITSGSRFYRIVTRQR